MTAVTAKARVEKRTEGGDQFVSLTLGPDYNDGRNAEWAYATPSLRVEMTVLASVGDEFEQGKPWTITFTPSED